MGGTSYFSFTDFSIEDGIGEGIDINLEIRAYKTRIVNYTQVEV